MLRLRRPVSSPSILCPAHPLERSRAFSIPFTPPFHVLLPKSPGKTDRPRSSRPEGAVLGVEELRFHGVGSEDLLSPARRALLLSRDGRFWDVSRSSAVPPILPSVGLPSAAAVGQAMKLRRSMSIFGAMRRLENFGLGSRAYTVADRRGSVPSARYGKRWNGRRRSRLLPRLP